MPSDTATTPIATTATPATCVRRAARARALRNGRRARGRVSVCHAPNGGQGWARTAFPMATGSSSTVGGRWALAFGAVSDGTASDDAMVRPARGKGTDVTRWAEASGRAPTAVADVDDAVHDDGSSSSRTLMSM